MARPRRRRIDPDTQRVLMTRAADLTALSSHPSWPELQAEVGRKRERIEKLILAKALGSKDVVDPMELQYLKGFVHGMDWFSQVPVQAEGTLERFLREQGVTVEGEART